MTCQEATELSGLYVLDALEPDERAAVEAHLATCAEAHDEFAEVGGVVPALASLAEPLDAPVDLKAKVMAAVAAEAATDKMGAFAKQPGRYSTGRRPDSKSHATTTPTAVPSRGAWHMPAWAGWTTALVAVIALAVVGVWAIGLQTRTNEAEQRAAILSDAIEAFAAPDSSTAVLDDPNSAASGFAAVTADGTAYVIMAGLPPAPTGQTYQAWYIADGAPVSAGLVSVGPDGLMVMTDAEPASGTTAVAFTVEPSGGSDQPTSDPFVVGTFQPA